MSYYTGSASSASDLLTKLRTHLVTDLAPNNWTLSGDVLHKDGCYVEVTAESDTYEFLRILGGTGVDGSNNLTGQPPAYQSNLKEVSLAPVGTPNGFQFPITYFLQVQESPDEVCLTVRDDSDRYSHAFWGQSPVPNLPGTGNYYGAQIANYRDFLADWEIDYSYDNNGGAAANDPCPMFGSFWSNAISIARSAVSSPSSFVHVGSGLDGYEWTGSRADNWDAISPTADPYPMAFCNHAVNFILDNTPNLYNGQAVLAPLMVSTYRTDGKIAVILDIQSIRMLRIDNLQPEDVLTIGGVKWKVYPLTRKNNSGSYNQSDLTDSGPIGWAIRYDGP